MFPLWRSARPVPGGLAGRMGGAFCEGCVAGRLSQNVWGGRRVSFTEDALRTRSRRDCGDVSSGALVFGGGRRFFCSGPFDPRDVAGAAFGGPAGEPTNGPVRAQIASMFRAARSFEGFTCVFLIEKISWASTGIVALIRRKAVTGSRGDACSARAPCAAVPCPIFFPAPSPLALFQMCVAFVPAWPAVGRAPGLAVMRRFPPLVYIPSSSARPGGRGSGQSTARSSRDACRSQGESRKRARVVRGRLGGGMRGAGGRLLWSGRADKLGEAQLPGERRAQPLGLRRSPHMGPRNA